MNNQEIKQRLIERDGLKCGISGEPVNHPDELSIHHIQPKSDGGSDDLDNLVLIKRSLNYATSNSDLRRFKSLTKELQKRQEELTKTEEEIFEREQAYRVQIEAQKKQLDELRQELMRDHAERERRVKIEADELRTRAQEQEQYVAAREAEILALQAKLNHDLKQKEQEIISAQQDLEREKERYREESRKQIENRSAAYVNEALSSLDSAAENYHSIGRNWSIAGSLALLAGVGIGIYFGVTGLKPLEESNTTSWAQVSFFAFKGIIVIGLFIALAKYCFTYGQSFTHEAIKNSERKHAINFGKFYLETYGADAEWAQVKEAFEHWNINSNSAFSNSDPDKFDPKIFDKVVQVAEAVQKLGKGNSEERPNSQKVERT